MYRIALLRAGRPLEASVYPGDVVVVECLGERFRGVVEASGRTARSIDEPWRTCAPMHHEQNDQPTWTLAEVGESVGAPVSALTAADIACQ